MTTLAASGWLGLALASCAAFSSTPSESVVEDAGGGASADAGAPGDATAATTATDGAAATADGATSVTTGSILPNGDFEAATGDDCGAAWTPTRTVPARAAPGHASAFACRACNASGQASFYVQTRFPAKPGTWNFEAWVRDAGSSPVGSVTLFFGAFDAGGTVLPGEQSIKVSPDGWTRGTGALQVPSQATQVYFEVYAQGVNTTSCFEFDDVRVSPP